MTQPAAVQLEEQQQKQREAITQFETHFQYDGQFMHSMLTHAPQAYTTFENFLPMAHFRDQLPLAEYWLAKIAAMQVEDCGACLQLNVRMAQEQGVSGEWIRGALAGGDSLPEPLAQVVQYARQVAAQTGVDGALAARIQATFSSGQLAELGLAVASAKVFPTIKRAMGMIQSCSLVQVDVA